jgi:hypothetical protein
MFSWIPVAISIVRDVARNGSNSWGQSSGQFPRSEVLTMAEQTEARRKSTASESRDGKRIRFMLGFFRKE